ncbi:MAG TPA: Rrf2 family transcriptional regulator [Candidatus Limnocylindria bacterium]|nr:Rrf2 family transcriptional regulator [Candidatus Limnocylindria bacterium]
MLSRKTKYAVRAMLYLAEQTRTGPIQIREIAEAERIPQKFLEAILVELKSTGLVRSRAGRAGGYELLGQPKDIALGRIFRLTEGPLALTPCVSHTAYSPCDDCEDEKTCALKLVMKEVRDSTARILDGTSLQSLIDRRRALREAGRSLDFSI